MTASTPQNPAENMYDVAVIGAGIIGLSAALALSDAGLRVLALDQRQAMHGASWAAAGMLAANDPHNPAELHALSLYSESLYPAFLARIHALTGRAIPIRSTHTLQGLPSDEIHPGETQPGQPLTTEEIQQHAPGLHTGDLVFSLMQERSLNPRDIAETLPRAARAAGIDLREHTHVQHVESAGPTHRLLATHTVADRIEEIAFTARHVLFATGAWTGPIVHASTSQAPTVAPCKGQLVALQLDGPDQTDCTLRIPGLYIVPRGAGLYIVGATLENVGFDRSTSDQHSADLIRRAAQLWPPLARAQRVDQWTGFRPITPDELPVIGSLSSDEKNPTLWVATGHHRNGILLAPGTAQIIRDLILGHMPKVALDAFSADRFTDHFATTTV